MTVEDLKNGIQRIDEEVVRRDSEPFHRKTVFLVLNEAGGWLGTHVHLSHEAAVRWIEDRGFAPTSRNRIVEAEIVMKEKSK